MNNPNRVLFGALITLTAHAGSLQAQIPMNNLVGWFRADAGVTLDGSGSNVVLWADQSGQGNDATQAASTPSLQPTLVPSGLNGHPALYFDTGGDDYLQLTNRPIDLTGGLTIFIVAQNDVRTYQGLFRIGPQGSPYVAGSDLEIFWQQGTSDAGSGNGEFVANRLGPWAQIDSLNTPPPVGRPYLYDVTAVSNAGTQRFNAVTGTTYPGSTTFTPLVPDYATIGVGYGGFNSLNGDIAELIIYNTALSSSQRDNVWAYLDGKYALGIPEPSTLAFASLGGMLLLWRRRS